jgi:hypothetical protein
MTAKCDATGKVIFPSRSEARLAMLHIRMMLRNKKRMKHRQGKAAQKRIYYCEYCRGFHLTRWRIKYKAQKQPDIIKKLIVSRY